MKVYLHPVARLELEQAADWFSAGGGTRLGGEFVAAYHACIDHIVAFPRIGTPGAAGTRELRFKSFPYKVVYQIGHERIVVVAIAHQRRRPQYWTGRTPPFKRDE